MIQFQTSFKPNSKNLTDPRKTLINPLSQTLILQPKQNKPTLNLKPKSEPKAKIGRNCCSLPWQTIVTKDDPMFRIPMKIWLPQECQVKLPPQSYSNLIPNPIQNHFWTRNPIQTPGQDLHRVAAVCLNQQSFSNDVPMFQDTDEKSAPLSQNFKELRPVQSHQTEPENHQKPK